MSQNEGTTTPPDNERGGTRSPTLHQDEPPPHQMDPLPSPSASQTVAEVPTSGQPPTNSHGTPAPSPAPGISNLNTNAELARTTNGTSHVTHDTQDEGHDDPEPMDVELGNSRDALEPHDWEELQERFAAKMKECQARELELGREFQEWVEVRRSSNSASYLSPPPLLSHYEGSTFPSLRFALLLQSGICTPCSRKTP